MNVWEVVPKKRKGKGAKVPLNPNAAVSTSLRKISSDAWEPLAEDSILDQEKVLSLVDKIKVTVERLRTDGVSGMYRRILEIFESSGTHSHDKSIKYAMTSLGIGRFSSSSSSLLQFALALLLKDVLSIETCEMFDPVFGIYEIQICKLFGCNVSTTNSYGKHLATMPTIFYMPHCPYRLYCNLLWMNRNNLSDVTIIGNSFESYRLRRFTSHSIDKTDCISNLQSCFHESALWKEGDKVPRRDDHILGTYFEQAFNDLSVITINTAPLLDFPSEEEIDIATKADVEIL